ncbi:MAG: hypothetical protein RL240_1114 [Planctomycetota bacterium]|jgi:ribosomal protein S20
MDKIRQQVAIASRRLFLQSWLGWLNWAVLFSFAAAFVLLLLPKLVAIKNLPDGWETICWVGAGIVSVLAASLAAWAKRPSALHAAVEIDRRYRLNERCSSVFSIGDQERESPVGQALLDDAQRQLERIDLRDHFPVRPAPQWAWVVLPVAACFALSWVPDVSSEAKGALAQKRKSDPLVTVKNATEPILKTLQKKIEQAAENGDQEAAEEFKRLQQQVQKLQNDPNPDPKKVIADLNEVKKELQQKKASIGDSEEFKESLDSLKDLDKGPAESMAKAMQDGDFEQAKQELAQLAAKMSEGKLDAEQTKQLQNQLEQLRDAMREARNKREELLDDAKRELDDAQREGNTQKIANLRKKIEKLEASDRTSQSMQKLEQQLSDLDQALESGDSQKASEAMESMQSEFEKLAEGQSAADELEEMIRELEGAKESSKCPECDGEGCPECQGGKEGSKSKSGNGKKGSKDSKGKDGKGKDGKGKDGKDGEGEEDGEGDGDSNGDGKGKGKKSGSGKGKSKGKGQGGEGEGEGDGEGEGRGVGDRAEKETGVKEYDAQVREQMRKGETVSGGESKGRNRKGISREELQEAVRSSKPDAPDAIENLDLPKAAREQLREYFDSLRDGKSAGGAK